MGISDLITGEKPSLLNIAAMAAMAGALGALVLTQMPQIDWRTVLLTLLAADIGAGLISNATQGTRKAWRDNAGKRGRAIFLIAHTTLYPAALFWLAGDQFTLAAILTAILAAKVLMFVAGQREAG